MPIWLRRFNIRKINEIVEKQNKEMEKAQKGSSPNSNEMARPNIPNKSSYNFKA
jgi:hypothetical protein